MKNLTCFELYFRPITQYLKSAGNLAVENNYTLTYSSLGVAGVLNLGFQYIKSILNIDLFGIDNYLVLFVLSTIFLDAYYGIKKSKKKSKEAYIEALKFEQNTPERKKFMKIYEIKKFKMAKLQFTFFKCFTFLGYLAFAKLLLKSDEGGMLAEVLGYTRAVLTTIPLVIFWYYDFKSIGDNSEFIYGKKASIFSIVEDLMEFRINNFLKKNKDDN